MSGLFLVSCFLESGSFDACTGGKNKHDLIVLCGKLVRQPCGDSAGFGVSTLKLRAWLQGFGAGCTILKPGVLFLFL